MRILAIDTAADFCALALHENGQMRDSLIIATERDQAKILAPLTQELLTKNGWNISGIDRFAVTTGPGSFTGLRVGLSFVRGLALANGKKALGFDHFQIAQRTILASGEKADTLIIRDSKRAELFCAWLRGGALETPFLASAETLLKMPEMAQDIRLAGNGAAFLVEQMPALAARVLLLDEKATIHSLAAMAEVMENPASAPPQPLYLRDADVSFPKHHALTQTAHHS